VSIVSAGAFGVSVGLWLTALTWSLVAFPLPSSVFVLMFSVALIAILTTVPTWVRVVMHSPPLTRHAFGWSAVAVATAGALLALPRLPDGGLAYAAPVWALAVTSLLMLTAAASLDRATARSETQPSTNRTLVLDTSAWIDGRTVQLAEWGLLQADACTTEDALGELKALADNSDATARARGRAGLDAVRRWREAGLALRVEPSLETNDSSVDERLADLARTHEWTLVTTDAPLETHAAARNVHVINPHALMDDLRGAVRTGERLTLMLTAEGHEPGQAVGHLDDGTLVVVDGARGFIGYRTEVEVTRLLQTKTGRMVFAKRADPTHLPA
jgi:rRNA-processing protein FCF1